MAKKKKNWRSLIKQKKFIGQTDKITPDKKSEKLDYLTTKDNMNWITAHAQPGKQSTSW